jgi:hypothetical protein
MILKLVDTDVPECLASTPKQKIGSHSPSIFGAWVRIITCRYLMAAHYMKEEHVKQG